MHVEIAAQDAARLGGGRPARRRLGDVARRGRRERIVADAGAPRPQRAGSIECDVAAGGVTADGFVQIEGQRIGLFFETRVARQAQALAEAAVALPFAAARGDRRQRHAGSGTDQAEDRGTDVRILALRQFDESRVTRVQALGQAARPLIDTAARQALRLRGRGRDSVEQDRQRTQHQQCRQPLHSSSPRSVPVRDRWLSPIAGVSAARFSNNSARVGTSND